MNVKGNAFLVVKNFYRVNIELTNVCNLQCTFCPEVVRSKSFMSVDLFRIVIDQVAPLTRVVAFHLMGDPLLHPNLAEFVEVVAQKKVQIFFVTNGVLLSYDRMEILFHPAFRQVSFSLHSFPDNFGEKDPASYLERIFEFTERAFKRNPSLFINYRLWNLSEPQTKSHKNTRILELIEKRFGVKLFDKIEARVKKQVLVSERLSLHFETEFVWPSLDLPVLGTKGTCYGLSSHFGILVDGTVVPCCLDKEGVISLGNLQTSSLTEILTSPRAEKQLQGFRDRTLYEDLCQRCQYIERFSTRVSG